MIIASYLNYYYCINYCSYDGVEYLLIQSLRQMINNFVFNIMLIYVHNIIIIAGPSQSLLWRPMHLRFELSSVPRFIYQGTKRL